jgi:hypothetical protein
MTLLYINKTNNHLSSYLTEYNKTNCHFQSFFLFDQDEMKFCKRTSQTFLKTVVSIYPVVLGEFQQISTKNCIIAVPIFVGSRLPHILASFLQSLVTNIPIVSNTKNVCEIL